MAGQTVRRFRIRVLSSAKRSQPVAAGGRCRAPKNRPMAGHSSAT
jgi:hypothetical protein